MAQINIQGIIGEDYKYSNFLTDYASCGEEPIRLTINSPGGDVIQGEQIAEFINKHAERFISVSNSGDVASIAASIFLSLPREKRFFDMAKGLFLIHNPFVDPFSLAFADTTAEGLALISDELKDFENRICKYISQQTGADIEVVRGFMKINEPLTEEQMSTLNIATIYKYQAVAFFNNNQNKNEMKQEEVSQMIEANNENLFTRILAVFNKRTKFVAIMLTDANGGQIEFPDVPEGTQPVVGDVAADKSLNGEVVMATGETYVFENGVLMEVIPMAEEPEPNPDEAMDALKAENEALKAELEKVRAEATEVKNEMAQIKSQMIDTKPKGEVKRKITDYIK